MLVSITLANTLTNYIGGLLCHFPSCSFIFTKQGYCLLCNLHNINKINLVKVKAMLKKVNFPKILSISPLMLLPNLSVNKVVLKEGTSSGSSSCSSLIDFYRHTSFCCTLIYFALLILHFFTNQKPHIVRLW